MKLNKSKRLLSLGTAALLQIASGSVTWTGVATAKSGEVYALRGGHNRNSDGRGDSKGDNRHQRWA
jgi:hypothetical protein